MIYRLSPAAQNHALVRALMPCPDAIGGLFDSHSASGSAACIQAFPMKYFRKTLLTIVKSKKSSNELRRVSVLLDLDTYEQDRVKMYVYASQSR